MVQLDTLDEQILMALQEDGRKTMKALAEEVGLSSPAMIERVRRLDESGVIAGYKAIVNPKNVGRSLSALISIELDRVDYDAFLEQIEKEPAIEECHRITGDSSFVLKVHVTSTDDLATLIDALQNAGAHCSTNIVLSTPIQGRPITPPSELVAERTRQTRRPRRGPNESRSGEVAL